MAELSELSGHGLSVECGYEATVDCRVSKIEEQWSNKAVEALEIQYLTSLN